MFEKFFGNKKGGSEGSGGGSSSKPLDQKFTSGVRAGTTINPEKPKPENTRVPEKKLPGLESSPFAIAIKDCLRPSEQKKKIEGMNEQEAFEYISGDGMAVLYAFLGKMRPETLVFLLEKLSRDHLKIVFEDIKKTNSINLLAKSGEKGDKEIEEEKKKNPKKVLKDTPSLVSRLVDLRIKSEVNFEGSKQVGKDEGLESVGIEIEKKIAKEMLKKIEDLRAELREYGYEVTPTQVDGKETLADLGELAKIVLEADEAINFRYNRQKGDLEAEKKVGHHAEFKEGGYEIIYDKKGIELADTNEEILAQVRIEARTRIVFNSFRKYLLAKYPERFPNAEENSASIDKKGTDKGL